MEFITFENQNQQQQKINNKKRKYEEAETLIFEIVSEETQQITSLKNENKKLKTEVRLMEKISTSQLITIGKVTIENGELINDKKKCINQIQLLQSENNKQQLEIQRLNIELAILKNEYYLCVGCLQNFMKNEVVFCKNEHGKDSFCNNCAKRAFDSGMISCPICRHSHTTKENGCNCHYCNNHDMLQTHDGHDDFDGDFNYYDENETGDEFDYEVEQQVEQADDETTAATSSTNANETYGNHWRHGVDPEFVPAGYSTITTTTTTRSTRSSSSN